MFQIFVLDKNCLYFCSMNLFDELFGQKQSTINSKRKGNANEAALASFLSEWTGQEFVRIPQSGGLRWKNAQNICGDLLCTNNDFDFPFVIETKHLKHYPCPRMLHKNSCIYSIWKQPLRDAERSGKRPSLFLRKNGMPSKTWHCVFDENHVMKEKLADKIVFEGSNLFAILSTDLPTFEQFKKFLK